MTGLSAEPLLERLDTAAGNALERLVLVHHRRRLSRVGQEHVLDAPPAAGPRPAPPPRTGNAVEFFVDGAEMMPRVAEAIEAAALVGVARRLVLHARASRLRERRASRRCESCSRDAAERVDVRVLAWAGAPLPLFRPDRREVRSRARRARAGHAGARRARRAGSGRCTATTRSS